MQTTVYYIIHCKKSNSECYYSKGIHLTNIPFQNYMHISLQKITQYNKKQFIYNLYPIFCKFQKALKKYYRERKNIKNFLNRELCGKNTFPLFTIQ
jgi:hypothetical protein